MAFSMESNALSCQILAHFPSLGSTVLKAVIQNLAATIDHEEMRSRLRNTKRSSTAQIVLPGSLGQSIGNLPNKFL